MANPAPTINQINAFNATQGTTIDFNIIGGTELVRSNRIYIYDLSDNSLICTHLYVSTESIHELPPNTDGSIVYESGKSSADFVNGAQYYAQIQTFTDIAGTEGGSGLSVAKMFWCLVNPTLTITTIPSTISTTSYNVSATYNANTSVVSNIIQQYQFSLYSATGSLLQSSGVVVGSGEQQGTSTAYDISYNFSGLSVGSSYYVVVDVTTTQGMSVTTQSNTFTVSIDTPTLGEATVVNNACDGYISVTSNLSGEYGGSGSGDIVSFETDSENVFTKLQVDLDPIQSGSGTPSPSNVRPISGHDEVGVGVVGKNLFNVTATTQTVNGITFTVHDDGTVTVNGTATGQASLFLNANGANLVNGTSYIINGCPTGGSINAYGLWAKNDGVADYGNGETFTYDGAAIVGRIRIASGTVCNNLLFKPMVRLATESDAAYEPYNGQSYHQDIEATYTPTVQENEPYLFKRTEDVRGDRESLELVGGTVNWNQLVYGIYASDVTYTESNGVITVTPTSSSNRLILEANASSSYIQVTQNHKYLTAVEIKSDGTNSVGWQNYLVDGNKKTTSASWTRLDSIVNASNTRGALFQFYSSSSTQYQVKKDSYLVVDLTQFFGSSTIADYVYSLEQSTAGSGIAWLRKYYPKLFTHNPYNVGELKSVEATAHNTVGFNQLPYIPTYKDNTGIRDVQFSGNCIRLIEGEQYEFNFENISNATSWRIAYVSFDLNGSRLSHNVFTNVTTSTVSSFSWYDYQQAFLEGGNGTTKWVRFTANEDCYIYFTFGVGDASSSSIMSKPCLHLVWDGERNGEYEPYVEHSYPLDDSLTLRGIPKIANGKLYYDGDTYRSDGLHTERFDLLDLGSLNWQKLEDSVWNCFYANISDRKKGENVLCPKYAYGVVHNTSTDKVIQANTNNSYIYIRDTAYSTASDFKTAMNGVYLLYEKANPTTSYAEPFESIQKVTPNYGTEEFVTTTNVPVGNNTQYYTREVYGGTLDLVSGLLTVTQKLTTITTFSGTFGQTTNGYCVYKSLSDKRLSENTVCNMFVRSNAGVDVMPLGSYQGNSGYYTTWSFILPSTITSLAEANTWLSNLSEPLVLTETLDTPQTYQLTPQQIQTLIGQNNVWSEQGDIELAYHIPITNLLVKRQDVDDVSGSWLTLYSQPITQASDMDFTFIDFLNQYGKTYKYALVPLLTQTQSGVEVEVEGGYTVSDEVQSVFDGVFIVDSTGSQKCKANVGYGNVDMNQVVGSITPIGAKYPIIITNSQNQYHNGSISGTIVPDDYYFNGNLSRIDMVDKRNELEQFLTNKRAKIIKDWNGNIWLAMIMDNVSCTFNNNYGMGIVNFNTNWVEVGDPTNQQDLQATGLINVGGV